MWILPLTYCCYKFCCLFITLSFANVHCDKLFFLSHMCDINSTGAKLPSFAFLTLSQRVLSHQDDTALLKAYIVEWRKFFTQCDILPKPFCQLEITLMGKQGSSKKSNMEDSIVRKVRRSRSLATSS